MSDPAGYLGRIRGQVGEFQISLRCLAGVWAVVSRVVGLFRNAFLLSARACGIWLILNMIYRLMLVLKSHQRTASWHACGQPLGDRWVKDL